MPENLLIASYEMFKRTGYLSLYKDTKLLDSVLENILKNLQKRVNNLMLFIIVYYLLHLLQYSDQPGGGIKLGR